MSPTKENFATIEMNECWEFRSKLKCTKAEAVGHNKNERKSELFEDEQKFQSGDEVSVQLLRCFNFNRRFWVEQRKNRKLTSRRG